MRNRSGDCGDTFAFAHNARPEWPPVRGQEGNFMRTVFAALLFGSAMMTWSPGQLRADDRRYYEDRDHHDRHEWNEAEARAWRHWITEERHHRYHDWSRANAQERRDYWRWRHEHSDRH
jgi:hypothetical protein